MMLVDNTGDWKSMSHNYLINKHIHLYVFHNVNTIIMCIVLLQISIKGSVLPTCQNTFKRHVQGSEVLLHDNSNTHQLQPS